jgi:uncharacterized lipoprotein YddW (UPF0748 family)
MSVEGERRLRLWERSPSAYDGVDFSLVAPRNAVLTVRLFPRDDPRGEVRREIPLSDLLSNFQNVPLDDRQNRLLVRRAPGDRIRVRFNRDSLVFSPSERFELEAIPHATGFAPKTALTGTATLTPVEGPASLWSQTQELTVGEDGSTPPLGPLSIPLPQTEGVYNVVLRLTPKDPKNSASAGNTALERRVQLIVIDTRPSVSVDSRNDEPEPWRPVLEIDPANPKWWERLTRWPQLPKWIPGFDEKELASGPLKTQRLGDRRFVALEAEGWRAFPLPLGPSTGPLILEVTYPTAEPQALGVSILEPNAGGAVSPPGLDSGVVVVPREADLAPSENESAVGVHRVVFWPRTAAPVVLLTNQSRDGSALVGRIRVYRGPERLAPAEDFAPAGAPVASLASNRTNLPLGAASPLPQDQRMLAAWFDKPLFPENFSAPEGLDEETGRSLDDWQTFYLGAVRMIEHLKSRGYNAVSLAVWCEGSALYPSRLLEPTPKYDTGALFVSAQDARRKDVLEMLLRLCDREGIRLIPALHFSTPLPAVEKLLRDEPAERAGLEWTNWRGRTWLQDRGAPRGLAPYYNPLDDRVQTAMLDVVHELVGRYGRHPSFGGVALSLGPHSYAQLPGQFWGYDDRTLRRFTQDTGIQVPGEGDLRFEQRDQFLRRNAREAWLGWRAQRLAALYRNLGATVGRAGPHARLYLVGVELHQCEPVEWMMRPALPRQTQFAEAMLHLGLDPALWKDQTNIVLPRPRRIAPLSGLHEQAVAVELSAADDVSEFFETVGEPAGLFYHATRPQRLEAFDAVSPFGSENTYTWLAPHLALHGVENRRRFAHLWAQHDIRTLLEGGWMLPLGQEDSVQPLLDVYRRLPNVPFDDVAPTMGAAAQPVVVRQALHAGRAWVYAVNDSPWPTTVELELEAPANCTLTRLSDGEQTPLEQRGGRTWWKVELAPYEVTAGVLSSPDVKVVDYLATLPPQTLDQLRQSIREIGARAYQLRDPQAQVYPALTNADFEQPATEGRIPGWEHRGAWSSVSPDTTVAQDGRQSLRLTSPGDDAPTWIRSDVIEPPRTGKITLSVWVRAADAQNQPELRLSAQWVRDEVSDYRPAFFGRGSPFPLTTEWREYVYPVPLPPAEVSQLRIGIDLYGPGEVWIDNIRLYDARFENTEKEELKKIYGGAEHDLSQGRIADCLRFLEGYWPQFLRQFVEPPPVRSASEAPAVTPLLPMEKPRVLDRLRRWSPTRLLPF